MHWAFRESLGEVLAIGFYEGSEDNAGAMKVLITLLFAASCFAQTTTPVTSPCATLAKCRAMIKAEAEAKNLLLLQYEAAVKENAELQARLTEATKTSADSVAVLDTLATQIKGQTLTDSQKKALNAVQPGKALDLGVSLEKDIDVIFKYAVKLQQNFKIKSEAYDSLVDRYNSTLQQANSIINSQNARLAHQQQISNALAIYSMMPKPQPYVLPPPPVFQSTNINCTSNSIGNYTYTNCY